METPTPGKLILIAERARRDPTYRFTCLAHLLDEGFLKTCYLELGKDRASGVDGVLYTVVRNVRHAEEPDAGNPPVRFCEGH